MNRNILYKSLILISFLALIMGSALIFVPKSGLNAAIAPEQIVCSPIHNGQVIQPCSAMPLEVKLPGDCRQISASWATSDPSVISVSRVGVLRAKRRGLATLTLHVRYHRSGMKRVAKKSYALEVGTPVSRLTLSARTDCIGRGDTLQMICKIAPQSASRKGVTWASSNPEVASVSQDGKITGLHSGKTVISARASDGTGLRASKEITIVALNAKDTHFIAHRGLCTDAPENTVAAFDLAGKAGFWGCECDIRESAPDEHGATDLIISHNKSLSEMTGVSANVNNLTSDEACSLPVIHGENHELYDEHICILSDFLTSCAAYQMVPVIEIKEPDMSPAAYRKLYADLAAANLAEKAIFISFKEETLRALGDSYQANREQLHLTADAYPTCWLLMNRGESGIDAAAIASTFGFDGIFLRPRAINDETAALCRRSSIGLAVCTYKAKDQKDLQEVIQNYDLDMATTDGKMFE